MPLPAAGRCHKRIDLERLAIFTGKLLVNGAKASCAVSALPTEPRGDNELLPKRQKNRLAGPFAFAVVQQGEELDGETAFFWMPNNSTLMTCRQITKMPLAGLFYRPAGGDFAVDHVPRVGGGRIGLN